MPSSRLLLLTSGTRLGAGRWASTCSPTRSWASFLGSNFTIAHKALTDIGVIDEHILRGIPFDLIHIRTFMDLASCLIKMKTERSNTFTGMAFRGLTYSVCGSLMTMDARIIHGIIKGDLPYQACQPDSPTKRLLDMNWVAQDPGVARSLRSYTGRNGKQKVAQPTGPVIYAQYLVDHTGRGPTRAQWRTIIEAMREYCDTTQGGLDAYGIDTAVGRSSSRVASSTRGT